MAATSFASHSFFTFQQDLAHCALTAVGLEAGFHWAALHCVSKNATLFITRDSIYAIARICYRPSVTRVDHTKTV